MSNIVIAPGEERLNYPCQRLARTLGGDYTSDCCFGVIEPKSGKCAVNLLLIGNRKAPRRYAKPLRISSTSLAVKSS